MAHTRVKFTQIHESEDVPKGWHLLDETGDGEYTLCGLATPEYDGVKFEKVDKGKITCEQCLERIRFIKTVKL